MTNGNNQYYGRSLICQNILERIAYEHDKMQSDEYNCEEIRKQELAFLFQESNVNSARLEAELVLAPDLRPVDGKISKKILEQKARELAHQVNEAWQLGVYKYEGVLTEELLLDIGQLIDPISNRGHSFRSSSANLAEDLSAIDFTKLTSQPGYEGYLNRFLREVNNNQVFYSRTNDQSEPITLVEKAVYSHFMIFYLQPLMDGNKRTARIVQNLMLKDRDIPPPVIYDFENSEYIGLILDAFRARRVREGNSLPNVFISKQEHKFFDYMGAKVLGALKKVNDILDSKKTFFVKLLDCKDTRPSYISAKRALTSLISRRDVNGAVRYDSSEGNLKVRGNVTSEDIRAVLDSIHTIRAYTIDFGKGKHLSRKL